MLPTLRMVTLPISLAVLTACGPHTQPRHQETDALVVGGTEISADDAMTSRIVGIMFTPHDRETGRPDHDSKSHSCAGAIIGPRHIVTAAHCVALKPGFFYFAPNSLRVRYPESQRLSTVRFFRGPRRLANNRDNEIGDFKLTGLPDLNQPLNWTVRSIEAHPMFHKTRYNNQDSFDLALITFDGEMPADMQPLNLAAPQRDLRNETVTLLGWGYPFEPNVLSRQGLSTTDRDNLERRLYSEKGAPGILRTGEARVAHIHDTDRRLELETKRLIDDAVTAVCYGDSGGPVFVNEGGSLKVAGLVSHGNNKGCENGGAIITDVRHYQAWLACSAEAVGAPLSGFSTTDGSENHCIRN